MFSIDQRVRHLATGALLAVFTCLPVLADDAEIYQSQPSKDARPNVLFIMDTSGSMDTSVVLTPPPYDPNTTYTSQGCDETRIYWSEGDDGVPSCGTDQWIPRSVFACDAASAAMVNIGGSGRWPGLGNPNAIAAQYRLRLSSNKVEWASIRNNNTTDWVECKADDGIHGQTTGNSNKWIANKAGGGPWTSATQNLWNSISNNYRFYTANYMNYKNGPASATSMTRLEIVRNVAIDLASSLNNVNLGLMRYSTDAQGGYVLQPVKNIADNRNDIITTLKGFDPKDGSGGTPLSETLYEAALYLQGKTWDYGSKSQPAHSVDSSRDGDTYKSPIEFSCQKNYVVYLTDGAPTVDDDATTKIQDMTKTTCAAQVEPFHDNGWTKDSGICMDEIAAWMADTENTDLQTSANQPGNQNANTYMIGFGDSLKESVDYLNAIAEAGGTEKAYTAGDVPTLTAALQTIFADLQEDSSTFVTPSISVNAFNRAQTDNDLFFSLFKVGKTQHWDGNLKKYTLTDNVIKDAKGDDAVGADGFFAQGTTSFWSPSADGEDVTMGGALSQLPDPDKRKLYTSVAGNDLLADANAITTAKMTDAMVGTGSSTTTCGTACVAAINWARGKDIDESTVGDQARKFMGDPIHGRPAVVTYSKTTDDPPLSDTVVYVPTNDGFLHAIKGITDTAKSGGQELWAYSPPELLSRLGVLRQKTAFKHGYGLDSDIRVLKTDKDQNGVVDGDDIVYLFFGMRMGGNHYYGLNVTDPSKPQLLWNIGPAELPNVGQSWSPPVVARVNVGGTGGNSSDPDKFVLIFGGGYDTKQESQTYSTDTVGNRIYMVDAKSGALLWSAGGAGGATDPDLKLTDSGKEMNNSIPGRITVIDTNSDGLADRLYAGDMGGRIWRFDITNGNDRSTLVAGGILAKLGAGGISPTPAATENRRFYNAPDVALIQLRGFDPFYNIAIGSGYRGHPLDATTHERFYSIRDKAPFASLTKDQYAAITPITDGSTNLIDITTNPTTIAVPADKDGWKISMNRGFLGPAVWQGEKVLSESTTVANNILFTTFEPQQAIDSDPCLPATKNRVYALSAFAGKPVINFYEADTKPGTLDNKDVSTDLTQKGIVGDIVVALLRDPNGGGGAQTICLAGVEVLKKCVNVGGTVRTFWNRADAK
jgi:type IV pilus assembly protein PilY1